jgi:hypothetical protein
MALGKPFAQSLVLGDMLVAKLVVETASSSGDALGLPFGVDVTGLTSGESVGGSDGLSDAALLLSFSLRTR